MIQRFTIYGERCTGTNYLEELILNNFTIPLTWDYGYKHFFGHKSLDGSHGTLFLCLVRNPVDWLNSLYEKPYHIHHLRKNVATFLCAPYSSYYDDTGLEILEDRNIYNHQRYKNLMELREVKLHYLYRTLPTLVKNYYFIKYEDIVRNVEPFLEELKQKFGLQQKFPFWRNIPYHKKDKSKPFKKTKKNYIPIDAVIKHPDYLPELEEEIGYVYQISNDSNIHEEETK